MIIFLCEKYEKKISPSGVESNGDFFLELCKKGIFFVLGIGQYVV
uniref:Uncharacterized protein n=1 Tax=Rhizophora mucronata TaxID=61149 RepID=A0A2P2J8R2_RHIMU